MAPRSIGDGGNNPDAGLLSDINPHALEVDMHAEAMIRTHPALNGPVNTDLPRSIEECLDRADLHLLRRRRRRRRHHVVVAMNTGEPNPAGAV